MRAANARMQALLERLRTKMGQQAGLATCAAGAADSGSCTTPERLALQYPHHPPHLNEPYGHQLGASPHRSIAAGPPPPAEPMGAFSYDGEVAREGQGYGAAEYRAHTNAAYGMADGAAEYAAGAADLSPPASSRTTQRPAAPPSARAPPPQSQLPRRGTCAASTACSAAGARRSATAATSGCSSRLLRPSVSTVVGGGTARAPPQASTPSTVAPPAANRGGKGGGRARGAGQGRGGMPSSAAAGSYGAHSPCAASQAGATHTHAAAACTPAERGLRTPAVQPPPYRAPDAAGAPCGHHQQHAATGGAGEASAAPTPRVERRSAALVLQLASLRSWLQDCLHAEVCATPSPPAESPPADHCASALVTPPDECLHECDHDSEPRYGSWALVGHVRGCECVNACVPPL